jgi:hypothetical protein
MTTKALTVGTLALAGTTLASSLEALGATDTAFEYLNDGATPVLIENGSASPITCTIDAQSVDGLAITDPTVTIAAGASKFIKALDPKYFNNSSGKVTISISAPATTVKAFAFKIK